MTPPCSFSGENTANPVIQANQNTTKTHILLIWEIKNDNGPFGGYDDGLYYLVGKPEATNNNYEWTNDGVPLHISNTDGNSFTPCLTQAMDHYENPTVFHLVWEQKISPSTSILRYYKIVAQDNYSVTFPVYNQNLSSGSGFQKNYAPSLTTLNNGDVKAVWLGARPVGVIIIPDGSMKISFAENWEYKVIYKDLATGQQKVFGTKTNRPTINKLNNTNRDFYFAYSEQSDLSGKVIFGTDLISINDLESIGKDVQIGNGRSESDVKANVFNSAATPLYFNLSASMNHVTPKKNMLAILTGREGIVYKDTAQFYFAVGDVIVNNLPIEFKSLPDTIQINTKELINTYLETEPFNLTDNSFFNYSVQYGITDSLAATQVLKNGRNINFKIEIVDVSTNAIIGLFDNIVYSEDSVYQYDNIAYQVNTSGIGNTQVKLRLVVNSNWEFDYALSERIAEETVLGKGNMKQTNFAGNNLVTEYDLAQNYPNPFNPSTTIKYQLPKDGIVTLKVYDILGSEVATLVNEQKTAGRYEVSFDASKLASGVYIYKLQSGEYVSSKKMMLLK
ncbi:MAG: T9SS type A sorting domain-containing protein [Ignavibacteriaceae bacterium]|jgi:hypothetical protein|nr:T9SS type A sorting domain-containing protein [Ignavibacteriaceae bacterium]